MDDHRKNAYRYLLYRAMLDIRPIAWLRWFQGWRVLNPFHWRQCFRQVRFAGDLDTRRSSSDKATPGATRTDIVPAGLYPQTDMVTPEYRVARKQIAAHQFRKIRIFLSAFEQRP